MKTINKEFEVPIFQSIQVGTEKVSQVVYVADDGQEFENIKDCQYHERNLEYNKLIADTIKTDYDFEFLSAKTDAEAEEIILNHRNSLLDRGITTSRCQYKIIQTKEPIPS